VRNVTSLQFWCRLFLGTSSYNARERLIFIVLTAMPNSHRSQRQARQRLASEDLHGQLAGLYRYGKKTQHELLPSNMTGIILIYK
jgi:hypothetical protein